MKYDRNYFRMLDDNGLINEGRDSMDELAIVLADRLADLVDAKEQLEAAQDEIRELAASRDHWQAEAEEAQFQLSAQLTLQAQ
jgi:hypothetical protein